MLKHLELGFGTQTCEKIIKTENDRKSFRTEKLCNGVFIKVNEQPSTQSKFQE